MEMEQQRVIENHYILLGCQTEYVPAHRRNLTMTNSGHRALHHRECGIQGTCDCGRVNEIFALGGSLMRQMLLVRVHLRRLVSGCGQGTSRMTSVKEKNGVLY